MHEDSPTPNDDQADDNSVAVLDDAQGPLNQEQFDEVMSETARETVQGPACLNCGHSFASPEITVCERCGYYASLGTFIEVDPWEESQASDTDSAPAKVSHVQVWVDLLGGFYKKIPGWAWLLACAVSIVIIESLVARFATSEVGMLRTQWSLTQLVIGASMVAVCHVFVYVKAAMKDDKFGLIDVVMAPLSIWIDVFSRLPKTQVPVITAGSGLVAVFMSLVVIGAIPYERLLDWGIEAPPEQNLLAAVVQQAKNAESKDQDLEEAMNDFTGDAGIDDEPIVPKETRNVRAECVVVGFRVEKKNPKNISSLVLAAESGGKLVVVGAVRFDVPPETEKDLTRKLFASERARPFVNTTKIARWVTPKFVCKVSCVKRLKNGRLIDPVLDRITTELDLGL